jgi:hypothetical protein
MIAAAALAAAAPRATVRRAGMPVPVTRAGLAPASVTGRGFRNSLTARTGQLRGGRGQGWRPPWVSDCGGTETFPQPPAAYNGGTVATGRSRTGARHGPQ